MPIDLGNAPEYPDPTTAQEAQMRDALGITPLLDALTAKNAEQNAADNAREFGGGVAFDGVSGDANLGDIFNQDMSAGWGYYVEFSCRNASDVPYIIRKGGSVTYYLRVNSNGDLFVVLDDGTNLLDLTASDRDYGSGDIYKVAVMYDVSSATGAKIYVNGEEIVSGDPTSVGDLSSASDLYLGSNQGVTGFLEGTISDIGLFNRALTASEVSALHDEGLDGFLARRPELNAGGQSYTFDGGIFAKNAGTGTISSATNTGFAVDSGASSLSVWSSDLSPEWFPIVAGETYRFELTITGCEQVRPDLRNRADSNTQPGPVLSSGTHIVEITSTFSTALFGILQFTQINSTSGGTIEITSPVTRVGAVAALPFDEGLGYQARDLSTNEYDALLSETGVEWLKPKREGAVRFRNVDAYNGGSGDAQILSSSRDILPEGVWVDDFILRNDGGSTVSDNVLFVQRNDRTTFQSSGAPNPVPITSGSVIRMGIDGSTNFQTPSYRNLSLDASGDPNATNLSGTVYYKKI